MELDRLIEIDKMKVKPDSKVSLKDYDTKYKGNELDKEKAEELLNQNLQDLSQVQDMLYAERKYSILIVLQAMDTAGKDSIIKHVMSGLNPIGVKVTSFKVPTTTELEHDYFWRHYIALPAKGDIGIFNRSHYENVLVTRVHPEFILSEHLPGIKTLEDIDDKFWENRFKQIRRFEKNIYQNGTVILKFFLHLSRKEQRKRLLERIDNPKKNWKFSIADLKERILWDKYQEAYEQALAATSTEYAPWFIVPADNKWFTRLSVGSIIYSYFKKINFSYPEADEKTKTELAEAKKQLLAEVDD